MLHSAIILLAFGVIYLVRPGIYTTGHWKKMLRLPESAYPDNDKKFVRALGGLFVLTALCLLVAVWREA